MQMQMKKDRVARGGLVVGIIGVAVCALLFASGPPAAWAAGQDEDKTVQKEELPDGKGALRKCLDKWEEIFWRWAFGDLVLPVDDTNALAATGWS